MKSESTSTYLPRELFDGLEVNSSNLGFYDYAAREVLAIQTCNDCDERQHPPRVRCGECGGASLSWQPVNKTGVIFSYTIVRHAAGVLRDYLPYNIALIELDDAPTVRLISNVVNAQSGLSIGTPVEAVFEHSPNSLSCVRFRIV